MSDAEGEGCGGPAELIHELNERTQYLLDRIRHKVDAGVEPKAAIRKHLSSSYQWSCPDQKIEDKLSDQLTGIRNPLTPTFDTSCEAISPGGIPDLAQECRTKIVILEFFTQCCINCIHSIEEVREALHAIKTERRDSVVAGQCEVKLISVHSPKFTREKNRQSVKDFVDRMKMEHGDVVNDPEMKMWSALGISCWPTILVFGPNPMPITSSGNIGLGTPMNLIYAIKGEGHGLELKVLLETSLDYFNKQFQFDRADLVLPEPSHASATDAASRINSILKYPGKVVFYDERLAIADSGNNRVLILTSQGFIQEVIGGVERGMKDGDFRTARFYNPQGIVFQSQSVLFVADTGNHAIRRIDLDTKAVTTLVQPNASPHLWRERHALDPSPDLKSPWDLEFYDSDVLLVAAAGSHQIFAYFFEPVRLFGTEHGKGTFQLIAGTGKEENRNNSYILKSAFAQPSGICVSWGLSEADRMIYIADSESSSIRCINSSGKVMALVGGNRDPCDLFTYGDQDGSAYEVKLQHPVGVCSSNGASQIFIADTYNNKVKVIETGTKRCTTLIGDGSAGNRTGDFSECKTCSAGGLCRQEHSGQMASFNEPGGLALDDRNGLLYIADTNNHCIKIGNLFKQSVSLLDIKLDSVDSGNSTSHEDSPMYEYDKVFTYGVPVHQGGFTIILNFLNMTAGLEGVKWKVDSSRNLTFDISQLELPPESIWEMEGVQVSGVEYKDQASSAEFSIKVDFFFCGDSTCSMKTKRFKFILPPPSGDAECWDPVEFTYDYMPGLCSDFITNPQAASAS